MEKIRFENYKLSTAIIHQGIATVHDLEDVRDTVCATVYQSLKATGKAECSGCNSVRCIAPLVI